MRVSLHKNLRGGQVLEVSRIVIEDKLGNPVLIAMDYGDGLIVQSRPGDPDFNNMLQSVGITKIVDCTDIKQKPLNQVVFDA